MNEEGNRRAVVLLDRLLPEVMAEEMFPPDLLEENLPPFEDINMVIHLSDSEDDADSEHLGLGFYHDENRNEQISATFAVVEDEDEERPDEERPDWSLVPRTATSLIMSHLPEKDRANMARVCRVWAEEINNPNLWRERRIYIKNDKANNEKLLKYAVKHGQHLRYLTLAFSAREDLSYVQRSFGSFLNILIHKNTQLRRLTLNRLGAQRKWRGDVVRNRMVNSLCRFLRNQNILRTLDITAADFPQVNGVKVLASLGGNVHRRLTVLNMENMFFERKPIFNSESFIRAMEKFRNLRVMNTKYNYFSSELLLSLTENCRKSLQSLNIHVHKNDANNHKIDSFTWQQVKKKVPALRVSFMIDIIGDHDTITRVLPRGAPVQKINIFTGNPASSVGWILDVTLKYIAESFKNYLVDFTLTTMLMNESLDEGVQSLLLKAKMLEELTITGNVSLATMERIYEWQEEYKIGLSACEITSTGMSMQDCLEMEQLNNNYSSMLEERGLREFFPLRYNDFY